jgi:hypothetical protein
LAQTAELNPDAIHIVIAQTYTMVAQCKLNIIRLSFIS